MGKFGEAMTAQLTRTEGLCQALGWQGGTIHQVAAETGVDGHELIYGEASTTAIGSDYCFGWCAARTNEPAFGRASVYAQFHGNRDFWLGVGEAMRTKGESLIEKALEILRTTRDGDDLAPPHLKLVEMAVNGLLNAEGEFVFEGLYRNATKQGGYTAPWFHDIEHLTRDHLGYVRWKGQIVEHYDSRGCYTEKAKQDAEEVARRCRHLETLGETPDTQKVIWRWEEWEQKTNTAGRS